jgi:hypothetical protein
MTDIPPNLRKVLTCWDCKHFAHAFPSSPHNEIMVRCSKYLSLDIYEQDGLVNSVCDDLEVSPAIKLSVKSV